MMPEPTERSPWAPPVNEPKPQTIEEAYEDGLRDDAESDDMKTLVGPVTPVQTGDTILIKRSESSGGAIEEWRLTDRVSKSGKRIAESLEPILVDGVKDVAERPINDEDLTPEGQYSLAVQREQRQAEADRQALIREAQDEIENLRTSTPSRLPATHSVDAVPGYRPVEAVPSVPYMAPLPPNTVDENARVRKITVIDAQPKNPPKKKWHQ